MSTDHPVQQPPTANHDRDSKRDGSEDADDTPRSEVPVAVTVDAPASGEHSDSRKVPPAGDYFTRQLPSVTATSAAQHTEGTTSTLLSPVLTLSQSAIASASDVTASGHIQPPDTASIINSERPSPHSVASNISVQSIDSNATITAAPRQDPPRPVFPNQSYAALHNQQHPPIHLPPTLRQRSSQPGQIYTFATALASTHPTGSRTVGNSPAVTPGVGLFNASALHAPQESDSPETPGTYASPFLHFMHRQAPKETHVADVDVDPISGRKLVNHYEIIDELGRGMHGKVKLGRDLTTKDQAKETFVAIKIVERYSKRRKLGRLGQAEDKVKKEVAILKKARHPNVVALLEVIDDPSRKKVYIVLEWVEKGEIHWRVKAQSKEIAIVEARRYERERRLQKDPEADAEDDAILAEALKRLSWKKRHDTRKFRQIRQVISNDPHVFSAEVAGDHESEAGSEDDRLSRSSTATGELQSARVFPEETRLPSRGTTPQPSPGGHMTPMMEMPSEYLALSPETDILSPTAQRAFSSLSPLDYQDSAEQGTSGLRSTELSAKQGIDQAVRTASDESAIALRRRAVEVLESELNPELSNVPVMTLQQTRVAFRDTLLGLQYLHYQGIVHRDIKPPNLLATLEQRVKISDFGVSYLGRPLGESGEEGEDVSEHEALDLSDEAKELAKTVGTPAFYAPELCITEQQDDPLPVTKAIDVWALGITLFCMLFARTPFVDNEFVVMRQIADEEIYIPRKRLQPVVLKPQSRPPSHTRGFPATPNGRRSHTDLTYEDIDDDLHDLLKRLLTKDPRQRITLEEVRHHPWLVADLPNPVKWLEETDPSRQSQGKKIEVSKEDVNTAVVPLHILDRVRSGIKKGVERIFGGSKASSRGRAASTAGVSTAGSPAPSASSSSTTISQDARRESIRGDESIFTALQKSREGEHPLSQSLAASPEHERSEQFFDRAASAEPSETASHPTPSRPSPPERSKTTMSNAGSVRTLKQSDFPRSRYESPPPSPGLPGTPIALESPGGHGLSAILGSGPARRVLKNLRDRSTPRRSEPGGNERRSMDSYDTHAEASLAVSQTVAAGHVNRPDALREIPPSNSIQNSPVNSRPQSSAAQDLDRLDTPSAKPLPLSRDSSASSITSPGQMISGRRSMDYKSPTTPQSRTNNESSAEDWQKADEERIRKLIREGQEEADRQQAGFIDRTCPPSPDDQRARNRDSRRVSVIDISTPMSSHETSPTSHGGRMPPAMSSTSDFGSAISMSRSNPSIPSVVSEATSIDPADGLTLEEADDKRNDSSDGTINTTVAHHAEEEEAVDEGYSPDGESALSSDSDSDFDSDTDSDGGLVMTRRKSAVKQPHVSSAAGGKDRRGTGLSARSKKSSRSGSSHTMKKVRTRDSETERRRPSDDISE